MNDSPFFLIGTLNAILSRGRGTWTREHKEARQALAHFYMAHHRRSFGMKGLK